MDDKLLAALIAAGVSLVVALLGHLLGPYGQKAVERFKGDIEREVVEIKARLDDRNSATSARRDYEYEARKRLYAEVEPLLFQLYEALEEAHYRVRSLVRTARQGNLGRSSASWVSRPGSYYLRSTMYKLIVPTAFLRLMQRRVTFVDLKLDMTIELRYLLLKLYSRSFTDDFVLAGLQPALAYDPNHQSWPALRSQQPAVYCRQALVLGDLENIADALLVQATTGIDRVASFGEFESGMAGAPATDSRHELEQLFVGFSPEDRPVLARILTVRACLGQLIVSTYHAPTTVADLIPRLDQFVVSTDCANALKWPSSGNGEATIGIARTYLAERLDWLTTGASWINRDHPNG